VSTLATVPNLEQVKLEVTYAKRSSLVGSVEAANQVKVSLSGPALATLVGSHSLRELHLSRLSLKAADFKELAEAIKTTPNLQSLYLPHCNIDDEGCVYLALAIGSNHTLETVDLSCNKLSDEGCISIATALKGNSCVKCLRLWGNIKISNAGFDALADMLEHNCVLERVPLMAPLEYQDRFQGAVKKNRKAATNQAA
jgi:Ran GTPase-activating protein (RanGAP) involved in mRNA processing and transport